MDGEGRSAMLGDALDVVTPASASVAVLLGNLVYGLEVECLAPEAYALLPQCRLPNVSSSEAAGSGWPARPLIVSLCR